MVPHMWHEGHPERRAGSVVSQLSPTTAVFLTTKTKWFAPYVLGNLSIPPMKSAPIPPPIHTQGAVGPH